MCLLPPPPAPAQGPVGLQRMPVTPHRPQKAQRPVPGGTVTTRDPGLHAHVFIFPLAFPSSPVLPVLFWSPLLPTFMFPLNSGVPPTSCPLAGAADQVSTPLPGDIPRDGTQSGLRSLPAPLRGCLEGEPRYSSLIVGRKTTSCTAWFWRKGGS